MSKMSQLNLVLQEQAEELGFSTVQEALDNGYTVVMHCENGVCEHHLRKKSEMIAKRRKHYAERDAEIALYEQEAAHKAWLKEKEDIVRRLLVVWRWLSDFSEENAKVVSEAIDFIERGEV